MKIIPADRILTKTPAEQFTISVSFESLLASGDTLSTCSVAAEDYHYQTDYSSGDDAVLGGVSATVSTPNALVVVQNGVSGRNYILTFTGESAAGDVLSTEVLMRVR